MPAFEFKYAWKQAAIQPHRSSQPGFDSNVGAFAHVTVSNSWPYRKAGLKWIDMQATQGPNIGSKLPLLIYDISVRIHLPYFSFTDKVPVVDMI